MGISIVVAMSENRVIGHDGMLPRNYPEDLKRFKEITSGHTVVMGRKTYESIPERFRPLSNRENIVLTRGVAQSKKYINDTTSVEWISSPEKVFSIADGKEIFIIGGAEIYQIFLSQTEKIFLTLVKKNVDGDTFFPQFEDDFRESERVEQGEIVFLEYRRL